MNTNGGGLSYTHPGMYGMFLLVEAAKQLRGECGERQVDGAEIAVAHGAGFSCRACRRSCSERRRRCERGSSHARPTRARPYWEATRDKRLLLQWCLDCEHARALPACRVPAMPRLSLRATARHRGARTVHAVVVEHRPPSPFDDDQPYAVALVDLAEGPRMVTNVVGCPPMDVQPRHGRARSTWEPMSDGRHLPLFERHSELDDG